MNLHSEAAGLPCRQLAFLAQLLPTQPSSLRTGAWWLQRQGSSTHLRALQQAGLAGLGGPCQPTAVQHAGGGPLACKLGCGRGVRQAPGQEGQLQLQGSRLRQQWKCAGRMPIPQQDGSSKERKKQTSVPGSIHLTEPAVQPWALSGVKPCPPAAVLCGGALQLALFRKDDCTSPPGQHALAQSPIKHCAQFCMHQKPAIFASLLRLKARPPTRPPARPPACSPCTPRATLPPACPRCTCTAQRPSCWLALAAPLLR